MGGDRGPDARDTLELEPDPGGVHDAITQPAPYVEELERTSGELVGSIPLTMVRCVFQPIADLRSGATVGYEAFVRGTADGLRTAEDLFSRAMFENKVGELGRALRELITHEAAGEAVFLSVHPNELKEGHLVRPDDPLARHESGVMLQLCQSNYSATCKHILGELGSRSGVTLVLDDFGTGAGDVKQLVELCPGFVKLDRELVAGLDTDARKRAAVMGTVRLCRDLEAQVIAKGIDCEAELEAALDCGVCFGEGYVLGEPAPLPTPSTLPPRA